MPGTITIDGVTYAAIEPAQAAPASPTAASPFAAAGLADASGKLAPADTRPDVIRQAAASAPAGKAQQWAREAARLHRVATFACTIDDVRGDVTISAHGFAWPKRSGDPCPGTGCTGKVL
jgi:hypothetical protein